jgi:uncharacterized membrane protein YcaP (DUF421 family)
MIMNDIIFFWGGWEPILRIVTVGTLTYFGIILILRVSGKRTLASMNAFDFIITITMGSAFGRILTAKSVSLAESLTAFLLLVCLQYLIAYLEVKSKFFHRLITSQPALLYYNGAFIEKNLRRERIRRNDLLGAVRKKKFADLNEVEAIIMETDGSFSIIRKSTNPEQKTYSQVLEKNL